MSRKTKLKDNVEVFSLSIQSYYMPFGIETTYWYIEGQAINIFSDNIFMPKYSDKQIPFIETPHYETYKKESLEIMIKNWQILNSRLLAEKSAKVPNVKKIKAIESKMAMLKDIILKHRDFISKNIKQVSVKELFNGHAK